jgi:hypothetical protein
VDASERENCDEPESEFKIQIYSHPPSHPFFAVCVLPSAQQTTDPHEKLPKTVAGNFSNFFHHPLAAAILVGMQA